MSTNQDSNCVLIFGKLVIVHIFAQKCSLSG
jgi:hypothetical protein